MGKLSFTPRALVDYEAAARWYSQQNPALGRRFQRAMNDCLKRIAIAPRLQPLSEYGTRRSSLRPFPYSVYYAEKADGVHVIAIVHGRRHPDAWSSGFATSFDESE